MAPISSAAAAVLPARLAPDPLSRDAGSGRGLLRQARLELGPPEMFDAIPDEIAPRADLKNGARDFPQIDRSQKGDPLVNLRPSLSGRLRQPGALNRLRADMLTFDQDAERPCLGLQFSGRRRARSRLRRAFRGLGRGKRAGDRGRRFRRFAFRRPRRHHHAPGGLGRTDRPGRDARRFRAPKSWGPTRLFPPTRPRSRPICQ